MINIFPSTKIYITCPPVIASGGPLALHQLAFKLKSQGHNVYIYYNKKIEGDPVHANYKDFNLPYVFEIDDIKENILIVPEIETKLLYSFINIRKAIWWLSIDNYFRHPLIPKIYQLLGYSKPNIRFTYFSYQFKHIFSKKKEFSFADLKKFYHLVQSEYAYRFIWSRAKEKKIDIAMLSDYLLPIFFVKQKNKENKENIVLYNPLKGEVYTKKLISHGKNIKWIPIQNMMPHEVKDLLSRAKIYIDFGEHPGRDRFPREAVISGCCIITGKRGSAAFKEDMPIEKEFKFEETTSNIPVIIDKINDVLENYELEYNKFEPYREFIKGNEKVFEKEISKIFAKSND